MGLRYRKSIKLGPMRINLSKSGIGWSVGVKDARFTKKANGGYRTTMSVPGTGVSYTKDYTSKPPAQNKSAQTSCQNQIDPAQREQILSHGYEHETKRTGSAARWVVGFLAAALLIAAVFVVKSMLSGDQDAISTEDIPETAIWYPESEIAVTAYPGNVEPGDRVSVSVRGIPYAIYHIAVLVGDAPIESTDLISSQSGMTGTASWSWDIPKDAPPGQYYIIITADDEINCVDYAVLDVTGNVVGDAPVHDDPYRYRQNSDEDASNEDSVNNSQDDTSVEQYTDMQQTVEPTVVYVTESGRKYHNAGCRHLSDRSIQMDLKTAEGQGYTACKDCH